MFKVYYFDKGGCMLHKLLKDKMFSSAEEAKAFIFNEKTPNHINRRVSNTQLVICQKVQTYDWKIVEIISPAS
jgi:hypothetical protein